MYGSSHAPTLVSLVQKGLCHSWSSTDHAGHGNNIEFGGETKSVLTHNVAGKWSNVAAVLMICSCHVGVLLALFCRSAPD